MYSKVSCILLIVLFQTGGFAQFSINEQADGFLVREGDQNIFFYQKKTKSLEGKYPKSHYIHPLYNLDGEIISEDFPEDHPHHRGVFWTWHQILIGDSSVADGWDCKNISWDVQEIDELMNNSESLKLRINLFWKSPLWLDEDGNRKSFLEETTFITVHKTRDKYRSIDFEINLKALEKDVKTGGSEDEKGYGGFSVRTTVPEDLTFISGDTTVKPEVLAVTAGSWMDFSGTFVNTKCGVTILTHPQFPAQRQKWIIRDGNLFRSLQNVRFPGREPVDISMDKPLTLKYRLVIHKGEAADIDIDRIYQNYIKD